MVKYDLVEIVCSSALGLFMAFSQYKSQESYLEHYINRRAREERVMQFERGEPQSETVWDNLRGTGDITTAGLCGLGIGVLFYAGGRWGDKRAERKRKEEMKKENPELYASRYPDEKE